MSIALTQGDARHIPLADETVQCVVTSPPYWGLRSYNLPPSIWGDAACEHEWGNEHKSAGSRSCDTSPGELQRGANSNRDKLPTSQFCHKCGAWSGCLGNEPSMELYVAHLVEIFREVKRVLRKDGVVWLNLGESYAGSGGYYPNAPSNRNGSSLQAKRNEQGKRNIKGKHLLSSLKPKDLCMIPARVALALQAEGWWLRSKIIWAKGISCCEDYDGSSMPESVTDRPSQSYEEVFLLSKSRYYFYDNEAVKEPTVDGKGTRTLRNVWAINPASLKGGAHFATMPPALAEICIKAGTSERGRCPICSAPWKRIIEKTGHVNKREPAHQPGNSPTKTDSTGWAPTTRATGAWQPTCSCGADPVPCIVLDMFSGVATSGLVASRLGRSYVGIDANLDYCKMGRQRIIDDCPMFAGL